jgi:hypothetical protein
MIRQMRKLSRWAVGALSILILEPLGAVMPEHSVSPSQQFIIYGGNASLRGIISNATEETKANLLGILRQPDRWYTPIIINLQPRQANLPEIPFAQLHFSQTGFGLKLQLDLIVTRGTDAALIERESLRAIILEMIYRRELNVAPGTTYVEPPDWLLDGILALMPGRDREPLIDALDISGKTISLPQFIRQRPVLVDAPARLLYHACAFAFLKLLIDTSDGSLRLAHYIETLPAASNDPLADLQAEFPVLRGDLKEIWSSKLASITGTQRYELLTFNESNRRLDLLLHLNIPDAKAVIKTVELKDLIGRKFSPSEKMILDRLSRQLQLLAIRANTVMRPIVRDYQEIAVLLGRGERRKIAERLARIEETRAKLAIRMNDIDDYLNWFEATQAKSQSGMFADYLKSAVDHQSLPSRRRDALSVYLDSVESQF